MEGTKVVVTNIDYDVRPMTPEEIEAAKQQKEAEAAEQQEDRNGTK